MIAWWGCARAPHELRTRLRALVASLFAATFALLFYARYGIDMLSEHYVGLFYYSVPALAVAYSVLVLISKTRLGTFKPLVLIGSLVLLGATFSLINKPVPYTQHYGIPGVAAAFDALQAKYPNGHLVLDMDTANNWAHVWSMAAALEAYSARKNVKLFCVNQNWHILFTKAYRCSDEDIRVGKRLAVTFENAYPDRIPAFSALGLSLYEDETSAIADYRLLTVANSRQVFNGHLLASGWASLEADRVWSEDKQANILFKTTSQGAGTLKLDLEAFLPKPESSQSVSFVLNGKPVLQVKFSVNNPRQTISIPVAASEQVQALQLLIENPISPKSAGFSSDERQLGVALFSLEFYGVKQ